MAQQQQPDTALVLSALQACSNPDPSVRQPAEAALKQWEDSTPGYLSSLLSILQNTTINDQQVPPQLRLLASILAKNAIPNVWGMFSYQQDDNKSTDQELISKRDKNTQERLHVRTIIPQLLFTEPDEKIALHLRLALAAIACFDFPIEWPTLLQDLINVAVSTSNSAANRIRAVKATRDVIQSAKHRKIIIKQPGGARSFLTIRQAMQDAAKQQQQTRESAGLVVSALTSGALGEATNFLSGQPNWEFSGKMCSGYLKGVAELFSFMTSPTDEFKAEASSFLTQVTMLLEQTSNYQMPFPGEGQPPSDDWTKLVDKVYRHTLSSCLAAMERMPLVFAPNLARCLECVVTSGIINIDESTLRSLPIKRLVGQARFVRVALVHPEYDPDATSKKKAMSLMIAKLESRMVGLPPKRADGTNPSDTATEENMDPGLVSARQAIRAMTSDGGLCETLVQSLVTKFLRLSDSEVEEWDDDPEGRFQIDEAERTPGTEAENCRHTGGSLLASMMERAPTRVGRALLNLAQQCQQLPQTDLVGLLHREACYRAIQICRPGMIKKKDELSFSFAAWWTGEIRGLVEVSLGLEHPAPMRMLQGRGIQIVQAYSTSLNEEDFRTAFRAVTNLLLAPDLVTALCAARCANHLALLYFKEKEVTPQLEAVRENSIPALSNTFNLANRVTSEECLRTVLILVSGLVEANGTRLENCLPAIAEQLPPLWERAGDSVPIHSCLVSVLTHLIAKIGCVAVENAHVQKVLFPLLDYCTDVSILHRADTLLEDGLRLWLVTLVTSRMESMGNSLTSMLPRLEAILRTGFEAHMSLKVCQFYTILIGPQVLQPLSAILRALLVDCCTCVTKKDENDESGDNDAEMGSSEEKAAKSGLTKAGTMKDGVAALHFCADTLQLFPDLGNEICNPALVSALKELPKRSFPYPLVEAAFAALGRLLWLQPAFLEGLYAGEKDEDEYIKSLVSAWLGIVSQPPLLRVLTPGLLFIDQKGAALSLCAAVCKSGKMQRLVGPAVLSFTTALQEAELNTKINIDVLVEAACGSTRQVIGDGPLGDSASRTREILKADPLLTTNLSDALAELHKVVKDVPEMQS